MNQNMDAAMNMDFDMDTNRKIQMELGMRIRYYRKQRKLSQEKLAELCSLHPTYIGQLERAEKNATIETLYHIARGLNISLSQLFADIEEIPDEKGSSTFLPLNIYYRMMELSPQKQKQLFRIMDDILTLQEI